MTTTRDDLAEYRRRHVPLYNGNRLKLGLFAMNCSNGMIISKAATSQRIEWDYQLGLAQKADALGMEVFLPVARWQGSGGEIDYMGTNYETHTYAAAMAASTSNIMTFATVHAPIIHPIVAAKMATTIDHISGGRFGMNVVMGWLTPEFAMFGLAQRDHEARYDYGSEWMDIIDRLWTESEPFDHVGTFHRLTAAQSKPKPIQPRPVVFNAGSSPTGARWAARHADFNFTSFGTVEDAQAYSTSIRATAREEFGRELGVLTFAVVICRDTEAEAQAVLDGILDDADWVAAENWMSTLGLESHSFDAHMFGEMKRKFIAGAGAARIVGTPEQVVEQLKDISDAGMDGVMLGFLNWQEELDYFGERVMPLLKEAGLRG